MALGRSLRPIMSCGTLNFRQKAIANKEEKPMKRVRIGLLVGVLIAMTLATVACGGGSSSGNAEADAEWAWLNDTKQDLDSQRQELADLRQQSAEAEIAGEAAAEEGAEEVEGEMVAEEVDIEAQIATLDEEVAAKADEFTLRLVTFLNDDAPNEGEPPTERYVAALRLKSDEDIILAQEWIEKGGDYKRALDIYKTALVYDPDNADLQAAKAEAEVRMLLGQANLHNVRKYDDKNVVAWFYPTAEGGVAAAVWFQPDDDGVQRVYQIKFQAVDPKRLAEEEED
jgi:hypothetical protein